MARLAGRRIIITGAASGIGRETALLFAAEGAAVALLDRSHSAAMTVAESVGHGAAAFAVDVADPGLVAEAVGEAAATLGGVDGLVHAAGIFSATGLADTTPAQFAQMVAVNLTGTFLVVQAVAPLLRAAGKGTIVTLASGVGLLPAGPGSTAYVASKGGVIAMTKSLAQELAPAIRVNAVCPGMVETAMTESFVRLPNGEFDPVLASRYALRRPAAPAEIAAAILFLTSDEGSFVTGIALPVDGGRTYH